MKLTLTEEQEMLKKTACDFLVNKCSKKFVKQMEESETGYSRELWQEMAELGWMGLAFPGKYGGGDMSFLDLALLLEEMGRACLPAPFFSTVVLAGLSILDIGSEEQKQEYLPKLIRGEKILTLALTEPGYHNYDAAMMATISSAAQNCLSLMLILLTTCYVSPEPSPKTESPYSWPMPRILE
jgi:alkylation response protein AidB-like acyl-CoA dehydrogenase